METMKIRHYYVEIFKSRTEKNTYKIEKIEIGLENDKYIVLKDISFTKLAKEKNLTYNEIGKPSIYIRDWKIESVDGIVYSLYTYKRTRPDTIKNAIHKFIKDKYGYLFNVNLEFIK